MKENIVSSAIFCIINVQSVFDVKKLLVLQKRIVLTAWEIFKIDGAHLVKIAFCGKFFHCKWPAVYLLKNN